MHQIYCEQLDVINESFNNLNYVGLVYLLFKEKGLCTGS